MHSAPTILGSLWAIICNRFKGTGDNASAIRVGFVGNVPEPTGGAEIFLQNLVSHLQADVESIAIARWWKQTFHYGETLTKRIYREKPVIESNAAGNLATCYLYRPTRPEIAKHRGFTVFYRYSGPLSAVQVVEWRRCKRCIVVLRCAPGFQRASIPRRRPDRPR